MLLDKTIAVIAMGIATFTVFYVAADHDNCRVGVVAEIMLVLCLVVPFL